MKCLVTGVAGFIGSSIAEKLLADGYEVIGIDNFNSYYSIEHKKNNLKLLLQQRKFKLHDADVLKMDLNKIFNKEAFIFHYAWQPGVRDGFGENFNLYLNNNIYATQKLLNASKGRNIQKFIFASSSSIYGQKLFTPISEEAHTQPMSLYGSSKLMSENICNVYFKYFEMPITD